MNSELAHKEILELIPAYVAGGLAGEELAAFESHVRDCASCADVLREMQETDLRMGELFANERPDMGFEDRVVKAVRQGSRRVIKPALVRVAAGMAAALVLGSVGVAGNYMVEHRGWAGLASISTGKGQVAAETPSPRDQWRVESLSMKIRESDGRSGATPVLPDIIARQNIERFQTDWYSTEDGKTRERVRGDVSGPARGVQLGRDVERKQAGYPIRSEEDGDSPVGSREKYTDGHAELGRAVDLFTNDAMADKTDGAEVYFKKINPSPAEVHFFSLNESAPRINADQKQPLNGWGDASAKGEATDANQLKIEERVGSQAGAKKVGIGEGDRDRWAKATGDSDKPDATAPAPPQPQPPKPPVVEQSRKIIRNGEIEFQVDSFDSSFVTISKIVTEQGGYVQSSSSDKLANGKVRGTVVVRVPPDGLDTLILKLRALGDLKSQKISAQDVTKVYVDLEGELKAARAMEERMLNIIKTGKGEIKDMIEAEKQLGIYREKIEKLEGEIRYYNNLVSLSTLSISLTEKDIRAAAFAQQNETVSMGMESEDVEKSRTDALKAIDEAKGRVIESNLKKYDAGQFAATVVAEVGPDAAGPLIDRLKQIGRVSRLDIDRKQSAGGEVPAGREVRVEKKDTRFSISIYNLANVAPRQTSNVNLAVANVEDAYKSILKLVETNKGRIVTSTLNRQKPEQTAATISFEVPSAAAESALAELRRDRDVIGLSVTENPDTNNVTTAKRGFVVQVISLDRLTPRETQRLNLAAKDVPASYHGLLSSLREQGARIIASQLNEQNRQDINAILDFEILTDKDQRPAVEKTLAAAGVVYGRDVTRAADTQLLAENKLRMTVKLISADQLDPREKSTLMIKVAEVDKAASDTRDATLKAGGRVISSQQAAESSGQTSTRLVVDVPLDQADAVRSRIKNLGTVRVAENSTNPQTPDGALSRARLEVTLANADMIVANDQGLGASLKHALALSVKGLLWTVQVLVMGLLLVGPWVLIGWGIWRGVKKKSAKPAT